MAHNELWISHNFTRRLKIHLIDRESSEVQYSTLELPLSDSMEEVLLNLCLDERIRKVCLKGQTGEMKDLYHKLKKEGVDVQWQ